MRLKLCVTHTNKDEIIRDLLSGNVEICDDASLVLMEESDGESIWCMDGDESVNVYFRDIVYIESLTHDVFIHAEKTYKVKKRLYQLEAELPPERFIRISNSVIIAKNSIKNIRPALSCKYILTLTTGECVDVTRTYYYKFKEYFGI